MEKMFGIAIKTRECYGHGDYGEELNIRIKSTYNNNFPLLFYTEEEAQKYIDNIDSHNLHVVGLEIQK